METVYLVGVDVGSTTVKTVVLDEPSHTVLYREYKRHFSKVKEAVLEQLLAVFGKFDGTFKVSLTGSAGLGLSNRAGLGFVQEVFAASLAVKDLYPDTDCAIELGGEDAKILFLTGGVEQRMNGSCAGGTGAFIDQMATLLKVEPSELDALAKKAKTKYPIASRCGVFAKSDIQPLLNQGAAREDVALSIFQAVVDQTVAGLAQGRRIKGNVLFLGGPLHFFESLQRVFVETLALAPGQAVFPELATCFMAYGSALYAKDQPTAAGASIIQRIENAPYSDEILCGPQLFKDEAEYRAFVSAHARADVARREIAAYAGNAYLGVDAGSTTTKLTLIDGDGALLYSYYTDNCGKPLDETAAQLAHLYGLLGDRVRIAGAAVTGYGEELIKAGLRLDHGVVETVAHFKAASAFCPEVDFIMDIGGQDIKCFKIKNGAIDNIMLNEACSSGCGSFIQTFANAMGYDIAAFSKLGLFAEHPVELGSRCTVFMNSSVKQAQKEGATVADISAGLSASVIKNAIYKVIRAASPEDLGENVVVQGGTFYNDAVLRAFEMELGRSVIRPVISGLMGAYGAALYAKEKSTGVSRILTAAELKDFSYKSKFTHCNGCTANCSLTVLNFGEGRRLISGNRCERGQGKTREEILPDLYEFKYDLLLSSVLDQPEKPRLTVGLPLALGFYEQLPFWHAVFYHLNIQTVLSAESNRAFYVKGQHTIPSDTVCYPAKLAHAHILDLLDKGVDVIFYPSQTYNLDEGESDNHYNCPVVAYYPETLAANIEPLNKDNFVYPYLDLNRRSNVIHRIRDSFPALRLTKKEVGAAVDAGYAAYGLYLKRVRDKGAALIEFARKAGKKIAVIAGRPDHIDPEINHGIQKLVASLGMVAVSEDAVSHLASPPPLEVLNQWTYHARLYRAAQYVTTQDDMALIQLVSFGCGIDAVTSDETRRILEAGGKLYTQLKIDEINNLGAVKIRLRSLIAAL
ncbi:MAG: acyl-CoA dehydratase activase-related protein [Clostridiales bacterium]|jgi:predicted CoA-substrate-specific enzyme activase|nr:acyl-CoA dehydratase activase-related protein [Clostridiales bacterium]